MCLFKTFNPPPPPPPQPPLRCIGHAALCDLLLAIAAITGCGCARKPALPGKQRSWSVPQLHNAAGRGASAEAQPSPRLPPQHSQLASSHRCLRCRYGCISAHIYIYIYIYIYIVQEFTIIHPEPYRLSPYVGMGV